MRASTRRIVAALVVVLAASAIAALVRDDPAEPPLPRVELDATNELTSPGARERARERRPRARAGAAERPACGDPPLRAADLAAARRVASRLSDRRLAGQRIVATLRGPGALRAIERRIRRGELAGVILFAADARSVAQARALARRLERLPRPAGLRSPLLVMIDQEGGAVSRLPGPPSASAERMGAGRVASTRREGRRTGELLARAGVNVDLAPVADVARRGGIIDRQGRSFSRDPRRAAAHARAFADGLAAAGVAPAAKHFPGLGAAVENTDEAPASITRSRSELRAVDALPFRALVDSGTCLVMLANAVYPALDPRWPAALSRRVVRDELRRRLGFGGVTVGDDLEARALERHGSVGRRAVRSAHAGVDLLLVARSHAGGAEAAEALRAALAGGRLDRAQAVEAVARVLALRRALARLGEGRK